MGKKEYKLPEVDQRANSIRSGLDPRHHTIMVKGREYRAELVEPRAYGIISRDYRGRWRTRARKYHYEAIGIIYVPTEKET